MKKQAILITVISVVLFVVIAAIIGVSASNREIAVKSKITAQQKVCAGFLDKMWKIIQGKAEVADEYKGAFKDIYPALIEGRYGNEKGGTLMKWITESNPSFDISLYKDLAQSIEAERTGFFMEQKLLIDLSNEHYILRHKFPNSLFIGNRPDVKITLITSEKTEKIIETGQENDIQLFKKK